MRVSLMIPSGQMLLFGEFALPLFVPPLLELVNHSNELVNKDLALGFVELFLILVDASKTHHTQPVLTAQLLKKPINMLLLMLCAISLNVSELFLLAVKFAMRAEIQVFIQRV